MFACVSVSADEAASVQEVYSTPGSRFTYMQSLSRYLFSLALSLSVSLTLSLRFCLCVFQAQAGPPPLHADSQGSAGRIFRMVKHNAPQR